MSLSRACDFNVNDETRRLYRQSSEGPSCKTGVNASLNTTLMSFLLFQGSRPGLFNDLYAGESRPPRLSPAERDDGGQVCPLRIPLDKLWASASNRSTWRPFGSEQFGLETCRVAHCRKAHGRGALTGSRPRGSWRAASHSENTSKPSFISKYYRRKPVGI
jgi:hypothetical protein